MTKEVFSLIESLKIAKNEEKLANINVLKKYFQDFYKKYPALDFYKISKITPKEALTNVFLISAPYDTIRLLDITEKYKELFDVTANQVNFTILSIYFMNSEYKNSIDNAINEKNPLVAKAILIKASYFLKKIGFNSEHLMFTINFLKDDQTKKDMEFLFEVINYDYVKETNLFLLNILSLNEFLEYKLAKDLSTNFLKKQFKLMIETNFPSATMLAQYLDGIYNIYDETVKELDKKVKIINRNNKKIDELIRLLNTEKEIVNIDQILNLCPDSFIKSIVVDYIFSHNKKIYIELIKEYEGLKKRNSEDIDTIFKKYNYDFNMLSEIEKEMVTNIKIEDLESIFIFISKYQINLDINSVYYFDINKLKIVNDLIIKGLLTSNFIANNLKILHNNNELLNIILKNIELLNMYGINIKNYPNSLEVLLNMNLSNSLEILNKYKLNITRITLDITFLNDLALEDKIDLIITMGLFENLESLDILNKSFSELYKLKVFNSLNIEANDLKEYDENDFRLNVNALIPNEILSILNSSNYYETSLPEVLIKYCKNNQILDINGIYISINRLLKNLSKFKDIDDSVIFYAIVYNNYYSFLEIDVLSQILMFEDNNNLSLS